MSFKDLEKAVVGLTLQTIGEDCTYTPNGGSPVTIKGLFEEKYVQIQDIVALKPTLRINLSDLTGLPAKGDQVLVDSVNYSIQESRFDGHGGSLLILKKA